MTHQTLLLAWLTGCPHILMEQESDVTEPTNQEREVLGKDYMHFSWIVIVYDATNSDHQDFTKQFFESLESKTSAHADVGGTPPADLPRFSAVTAEDEKQFPNEVFDGKKTEIDAYMEHEVFCRRPRHSAHNGIDGRSGGKENHQTRDFAEHDFCLRGFEDAQKLDLEMYANTANRASQRIVCSMSAIFGWELQAIDISTAFLQRQKYEDPFKNIRLRVDSELAQLIRMYAGFGSFNKSKEVLMLGKSCGLVDSPKR
eukprot:1855803-Amphidinium_carterae.1